MGEVADRTANPTTGRKGAGTGAFSLRDASHVLIVLGGWVLFFYWWWEVLQATTLPEAATAVLFILAVSLLTSLVTAGWVRYNLGIYRRKGPRLKVPDVAEEAGTDALGRKLVHPGIDRIRASRLVTVSLGPGDGKTLSPGDG